VNDDVPMIKPYQIKFEKLSRTDDTLSVIVSTELTPDMLDCSWPPAYMHERVLFYFDYSDPNTYQRKGLNEEPIIVILAKYTIRIEAFERAALVIDARNQERHFRELDDKLNQLNKQAGEFRRRRSDNDKNKDNKNPPDEDAWKGYL